MNRANDQCIHVSSVTRSHRFAIELQSNNLYTTGFLRVIYAILNASVILERNEKCLERNETRGGNLLLGGTVYPTDHQTNYISAQTSTRELYKCEHAIFERDSPLKRHIFFMAFNFKGAQNSTSLLSI